MKVKKMNDKQLIEMAHSLNDSIYVTECYSVNDLQWLNLVCDELGKRGYEINVNNRLSISKEG